MFKIERKIVEFVERNVNILFMLAITGLAIVVRYAGRDFVSGDMTWFLLGWFQKIADNGGIHSLKDQYIISDNSSVIYIYRRQEHLLL